MSQTGTSVAPSVATIITQQQFASYAQAWIQAVTTGDHLVDAFEKPKYERLAYASFDFQTVVWLVSTVGARRIKAQFVLVPDNEAAGGIHTSAHFSVVLYAVDAQDGRISAYFLGNNTFTPKGKLDPDKDSCKGVINSLSTTDDVNGDGGNPIAFDLAKIWLCQWTSDKLVIERNLFTSKYGPLQGYTFDLGDFMDPLFYSQKFGKTQELRVCFGLHKYQAAFPVHEGQNLTSTLGLVLRFYGTPVSDTIRSSKMVSSGNPEPGQPFYDLSTPNPPGGYSES